jgi:hypothetical protein
LGKEINVTENEAVTLLKACKLLAERLISLPTSFTSTSIILTANDRAVMQGYSKLLLDPIIAGPNLLTRLVKLAGLSQVEIYKLDQVKHMITSQRYGGLKANTHFQLGVGVEKAAKEPVES